MERPFKLTLRCRSRGWLNLVEPGLSDNFSRAAMSRGIATEAIFNGG
jgi:hypothetical protein